MASSRSALTHSAVPARTRGLPFTAPWLLAPMEGVTDPAFRHVVLALHDAAALGGAFTEFVRVVDHPLPSSVLRRHIQPILGPAQDEPDPDGAATIPVGVQLMGSDLAALGETARRAAALPVPVLDLNFGCPAKGALRSCAGSALLRDPPRLQALVEAVVRAVEGRVPVTAKIRAGYDDDRLLEDLARAAEAGGAAMLTVHARTRVEAYQPEVDWTRIARAVDAVSIPVCGNGGVLHHADLERMRSETSCEYVMVGQAALADPWIFSGASVTASRAARFLIDYADAQAQPTGAPIEARVKRIKQLIRTYRAGDLIDDRRRAAWLREQDAAALIGAIREIAASP